jgi:CSLREA domain-containing protein
MIHNRTCPRQTRLRLEHLEARSVPSTFTVNTFLDEATPDDGKLSLREAITKANTIPGADVIVLPAGVFKTAIAGAGEDANATGDFDVTGSVTIQGVGAGLTMVDGQQLDRVFDILGGGPSSIEVVLQGLTVRDGKVTGNGGGLRIGNANLVTRDCAVAGNQASGDGGGVHEGFGTTGNVKLVRTTVARNIAGSNGGGLAVLSNSFTVKVSTIRRNLTGDSGGGIYASTAMLTDSTVSGNTAGGYGGGINATTATLIGSTVSGNTAGGGGGGIGSTSTVTLTGSTVSGNSAGITGGGIWVDSTATLTNSTISGNRAGGAGGGVRAIEAMLLNCTIAENVAGNSGGGLFHDSGGTFRLKNTIVALNLVGFSGTGPDVSGAFTSLGHNLIGDRTGSTWFGVTGDIVGTAANPIDPRLGPLRNNGGPTKTMALLAGSPCIDAGDNTGALATDQRALPRRKDGNGDGRAVVDIGAFER